MKNEKTEPEVIDGEVDENKPSRNLGRFVDNPVRQLASRIESKDIDNLITKLNEGDKNNLEIPEIYRLKDNNADRLYRFMIFFTMIIFLVFAIVFLIQYNQVEILKALVLALVSFIGGLGLGKSLGAKKDDKDKN